MEAPSHDTDPLRRAVVEALAYAHAAAAAPSGDRIDAARRRAADVLAAVTRTRFTLGEASRIFGLVARLREVMQLVERYGEVSCAGG